MSPAPSHPLLGVGLMLLAVLMGSSLDAMAKWFTQHYPVPQIVCIRFGAQAAVLLALAPWIGRRAVLTTRAPRIHVARGVAMIGASALFVAALSVLPLATSVVLGQTSPLIAAAIAVPLLGERVTARHWLYVLLGFAGVVIVLRPAPEIFGWSVVLPIGSAACFALYQVMTKHVATIDSAVPSLFYPSLVGCVLALCVAPFVWIWPTPIHGAIMLAHGALCGMAHLLIIRALTLSSVSLMAPFGYAGLIWAAMLGVVVFGERLDAATVIGGVVIALSGILLAREAVRRNRT
ncbi:MAG: DMT family transporter [Alphaproteobacteria bacterium]|nr:DMT family transporter [Alphaproteobacteria bacterium]